MVIIIIFFEIVGGTSGEGTSLSLVERKQLSEEWAKAVKITGQHLMIQIGGAPLPDVLELVGWIFLKIFQKFKFNSINQCYKFLHDGYFWNILKGVHFSELGQTCRKFGCGFTSLFTGTLF